MDNCRSHKYQDLYPLYKYLEALIFSDMAPCAPKPEYFKERVSVTTIKEFIRNFPGLLQPTQLRKYIRDGGDSLGVEIGPKGEYQFDEHTMLECIERHCKNPYTKRRAQRYLEEYYQCD